MANSRKCKALDMAIDLRATYKDLSEVRFDV